jgi:copper chaperone NosL
VSARLVCSAVAAWLATTACGGGSASPAPLDTRNDSCSFCRMTVSDRKLASQLVASGEEPRFFDDLHCLAQYLREHPQPRDAAVFVADHRTGEWLQAASAVYARLPRAATPMASGLVAHASAASRAADAAAVDSSAVAPDVVLGARRSE